MRQTLLLFALLVVFSLNSCKKSTVTNVYEYQKSHKAWLEFKTTSGNSYSYQVVQGSWTGYGSETIITVKDGKVTERSFVAKMPSVSSPGQVDIIEDWKENEPQLGSHQSGAALLTLDEIYTEAKTNWLLKRDDATTYFETNNDGMISSCGYRNNGCADDCFRGIHIKYIKPL